METRRSKRDVEAPSLT